MQILERKVQSVGGSLPRIEVRLARHDDVPALAQLGARLHAESPSYAWLPFDGDKIIATAHHWIESKWFVVLGAFEDREPVGILVGTLQEYYFCDVTYASDLLLYVRPNRRGGSAAYRLVRDFRIWAVEKGALQICLGTTAGIDADGIGRWFERLGLKPASTVYKERIKRGRPSVRS